MDKNDYFSRENRLIRRAKRIADIENLSIPKLAKSKSTINAQNAGTQSVKLVREILDQYTFPTAPKLGYSGVRNVHTAAGSTTLDDGVVTVHAHLKTFSGVNIDFDVPIEIHNGELLEPSIIIHDGYPRVIAQSTFDTIVKDNTFYEEPPQRAMYSAPFEKETKKSLDKNRFKIERMNMGMFSASRDRARLAAAIRGLPVEAQKEMPWSLEVNNVINHGGGVKEIWFTDGTHAMSDGVYVEVFEEDGTPVGNFDINSENPYTDAVAKHMLDLNPPSEEKVDLPRPKHDPVAITPQEEEWFNKADRHAQYLDEDDAYPDVERNQQDDDWLDPAERKYQHDIFPGQEVTVKETLEIKDRGGVTYTINKGSKCRIMRDHAGDNKSFAVNFGDGLEAIIERHFLKSGKKKDKDIKQKPPKSPKQSKPPKGDEKLFKVKKPSKTCSKCNSSPCKCHRKKSDNIYTEIKKKVLE